MRNIWLFSVRATPRRERLPAVWFPILRSRTFLCPVRRQKNGPIRVRGVYVGPALANGAHAEPDSGSRANVLISLGSVVIVDAQFSSPLHTIRDDGTLRFDPHANTLLLVDTIIVEPEGTFPNGDRSDEGRCA